MLAGYCRLSSRLPGVFYGWQLAFIEDPFGGLYNCKDSVGCAAVQETESIIDPDRLPPGHALITGLGSWR
jgi:hypothetical protein